MLSRLVHFAVNLANRRSINGLICLITNVYVFNDLIICMVTLFDEQAVVHVVLMLEFML